MNDFKSGNCVYIIKVNKRSYKIGKTSDLLKRLSGYHTHLPVLFKVVRQYLSDDMDDLEQGLHIVFQHKRIRGEWFELTDDDLTICDNIARSYTFIKLEKQTKKYRKIAYSGNPLLQVMEANEKYLKEYSKIVEDIGLGLSTHEIKELSNGVIDDVTIQTIRKILKVQTPNSIYLSKWIDVVSDLEVGLTVSAIVEKHNGHVDRGTVETIKRILKNQLY
jgi:hypothetical protein